MLVHIVFDNEVIQEAWLVSIPEIGDYVTTKDGEHYKVLRKNWVLYTQKVNLEVEKA